MEPQAGTADGEDEKGIAELIPFNTNGSGLTDAAHLNLVKIVDKSDSGIGKPMLGIRALLF
jgi:hypothetical protein